MLTVFLVCAFAGLFSGFIAGFFGLGGGLVTVPTIVFLLPLIVDISQDYILQIAIGSSFVAIIITSSTSAFVRWREGLIDFKIVKDLAPTLLISTFLIGIVASFMPQAYLKAIFGLILLTSSIKMINAKPVIEVEDTKPKAGYLRLLGAAVGAIAAVSGTGGGAFITPGLVRKGVNIKKAVAISSFSGILVSLAGSTSFAVSGLKFDTGLAMSSGFLFWPAILGIVSTSFFVAIYATKLSQRIDNTKFKRAFGWFLIIVSSNFLINGSLGIYHGFLN